MAKLTSAELIEKIEAIYGSDENVTDEVLSLYEDITDSTIEDSENWKEKYEENDRAWRQRYKERFYKGESVEVDNSTGEVKVFTVDELFND